MRVSFDEALRLLSKWHTEARSLDVILLSSGSLLLFLRGWHIEEFTDEAVSLKQTDQKLLLDLTGAQNCQYGDAREFSEEMRKHFSGVVESVLMMVLDGLILCLFESKTG
jgi:hypothetical protein